MVIQKRNRLVRVQKSEDFISTPLSTPFNTYTNVSPNQLQPVSRSPPIPHRSSHSRSPIDKFAFSPSWAASSHGNMTSPWTPSSRCSRLVLRSTKWRIWSLGGALPWSGNWKSQGQTVAYQDDGVMLYGTSLERLFCTRLCLASRVGPHVLCSSFRLLILLTPFSPCIVLNIVTNRVVRLLGKDEVVRFLNLGIYQGAPAKRGLTTMVCRHANPNCFRMHLIIRE